MKHVLPNIVIDKPAVDGPARSLAEFGACPQAGHCNTAALRAAMEFCRSHPGTVQIGRAHV